MGEHAASQGYRAGRLKRATLPGILLSTGGTAAGCCDSPRRSDFWPRGDRAVAIWASCAFGRRWPAPRRHVGRAAALRLRRTRARPALPALTAAAAYHQPQPPVPIVRALVHRDAQPGLAG